MSWHDFWYDFSDFFYDSYAERQRNKYSNLVRKLQDGIRKIDEQTQTAQQTISRIHRSYRNNGGTNCGYFVDEFNKKEQNHEQETKQLLQKFSSASNDFRYKMSQAERNRDYWQEIVDREDREKQEYNS